MRIAVHYIPLECFLASLVLLTLAIDKWIIQAVGGIGADTCVRTFVVLI